MLNEACRNHITNEKEILLVVYALDLFRSYLLGTVVIVFNDYSALSYFSRKKDVKSRLIRCIFFLSYGSLISKSNVRKV